MYDSVGYRNVGCVPSSGIRSMSLNAVRNIVCEDRLLLIAHFLRPQTQIQEVPLLSLSSIIH